MPRDLRTCRCVTATVLAVALACSGLFLGGVAQADVTNGRIFYVSSQSGDPEIWSMAPDGSDATRLTTVAGNDVDPAVSPDGNRVAFASQRDGNHEIYVMNADGTEQTRLTTSGNDDFEPAFSPDGTRIAWSETVGGGISDLWSMNVDGSDKRSLTSGIGLDVSPVYSPDGQTIAFSRSGALWTVAIDGTNAIAIPAALGADPAFLPDGRIVFRHATWDIYVMDADGTDQVNLSNDAVTFDYQPAISPDGRSIVFTRLTPPAFTSDVYAMAVDGTGQAPLTTSLVSGSPTWARVPDPVIPAPTITDAPASVTTDTTPSFSFDAPDATAFECSLESASAPADFTSCTSPFDAASLADGAHLFKVRVMDGVIAGAAASHAFTVDTTGPVASPSGPSITSQTAPTFSFSFDEPTAGAVCSVAAAPGAEPVTDCTSPYAASGLTDGDYVFTVRGTDQLGNVGAPAMHPFTIDTQAPSVTIAGPSLTSDSTPQFTFAATGAQSFECVVRPSGGTATFSSCSSPLVTGTLADGDHEITVGATDAAGNRDETTHAFSIDTTGPTITIDGSTVTNDRTPTFDLSFDETPAAGTVLCSVAGAPGVAPSDPCSDPFTASTLADGDYVLRVSAADALGNTGGVASRAFTVDGTGPVASVTSGPVTTNDSTPAFGFAFDEPVDALTVECSVAPAGTDSFVDCAAPSFTADALTDGTYVFQVKAADTVGNTGEAATHAFTVDTQAPSVTVTGDALTNDRTPTFGFDAPAAISFACAIEDAGSPPSFDVCTSPMTAPTLIDGAYELSVRATDQAGNTGESLFAFAVDATGPTVTVAGKARTRDVTPRFTFTSTELSTYTCRIDAKTPTSCGSPYTSKRLRRGKHTLTVTATDSLGNVGAPRAFAFKVI